MQKLKEMQNYFFLSIFKQNLVNLNFIYSSNSSERLNIYRQTIYENMRFALEMTFPGVWNLLGKECADSTAYCFFSDGENLPATGCLDDFGDKFPEFLAKQEKFSAFPYISDYAIFEWYKQMSYKQESAYGFDQSKLSSISEDNIHKIKFSLIPSLYTLSSNYALGEIESFLENQTADEINLSNDKAYAIIARPFQAVTVFWVSRSLWIFINSLNEGKNLKETVEEVTTEHPEFNMVEAMYFLLKNNLIAEINYNNEVSYDIGDEYSKEKVYIIDGSD